MDGRPEKHLNGGRVEQWYILRFFMQHGGRGASTDHRYAYTPLKIKGTEMSKMEGKWHSCTHTCSSKRHRHWTRQCTVIYCQHSKGWRWRTFESIYRSWLQQRWVISINSGRIQSWQDWRWRISSLGWRRSPVSPRMRNELTLRRKTSTTSTPMSSMFRRKEISKPIIHGDSQRSHREEWSTSSLYMSTIAI